MVKLVLLYAILPHATTLSEALLHRDLHTGKRMHRKKAASMHMPKWDARRDSCSWFMIPAPFSSAPSFQGGALGSVGRRHSGLADL